MDDNETFINNGNIISVNNFNSHSISKNGFVYTLWKNKSLYDVWFVMKTDNQCERKRK